MRHGCCVGGRPSRSPYGVTHGRRPQQQPRPSHGPERPEHSEAAEGVTGAGFPVVRRGYDPDAVEDHLRRLDAQVQILAADRDAAVVQSRQMGVELEACRGRVERLRGQVSALVAARADRVGCQNSAQGC
jgi:hypothetical protein